MNIKSVVFIVSTLSMPLLRAEVGCMDNSHHMKKTVDYKTYHYVHCNCDCKHHQKSSDRGICSKCGHYRDPGKFEIIRYEKK